MTGVVDERDVRPVVERPRSGLSGPAIAGIAVAAGLLLFAVLDARRRALVAPAVSTPRAEGAASTAPPPLYVPPPYPEPAPRVLAPRPLSPAPAPNSAPRTPAPIIYPPSPQVLPPVAVAPPRTVGGPTLVVDTSQGRAPENGAETANGAAEPAATGAPRSTSRARAGMLFNRATTVAQGTIIPAVLETGFDSTRPGFARAIVQRDVRGFDGSKILIPRGSRLIGEYGSDTAQGQKRAMVAWSRLIRPDGVTIALGSPAVDPVGRGGIRANVNTHFFERFAGAILQSSLDIGVGLASRASGAPVIVALPGSSQVSGVRPTEIRPTLRVPPGRSVSVFVARDLDFTEVERPR